MSKRGAVNGWTCEKCGGTTYCVHAHDGVTPFYLGCRATDGCDGIAQSPFYPAGPAPPHVLAAVEWEWYAPSKRKRRKLSPEWREHVDMGGLLLRRLTDAGRTALAEPTNQEETNDGE